MKNMIVQRGQESFSYLGNSLGSEQGGTRPVLVIQNNKGNVHSPTLVVAPITSKGKSPFPTHVLLNKVGKLTPNSCVLLEHVRTIDRGRLGTYVGKISPSQMKKVNFALEIAVGLNPEFN